MKHFRKDEMEMRPNELSNQPEFHEDLLKKYDTSGPRYTSYPTAPQFTPDFKGSDLIEEIQSINADTAPAQGDLSLYFHLPFCESVCFFCGCNVTFTSDRKRPSPYVDWVIREMNRLGPLIRKDRKVVQLHWGGGTPVFFPPDQMKRLFEAIRERFLFSSESEIGLEVDPRETTPDHLETLGKLGFNRLSMGIQDFDPQVQKAVNRIQPEEMTRSVIEKAREEGFKSVSVDLIYGLPYQTESGFSRTLDRVISLNPDRVAVFNFAYLPEMIRHQKAIKEDSLPTAEVKLAILKRCIQKFTDAGYRYIGMDHFARPEDELCRAQDEGSLYRNFQGYTTHAGCDLHAFGVSAISQIGNIYSQNQKNIHEYESAILKDGTAVQRGYRMNADDRIRREVIMRLLCDFALDVASLESVFQIDFREYFTTSLKELEPMREDGLWDWREGHLVVLPPGRLLIRNLCMPFDAYLKNRSTRFSRTI